MAAAPKPNTGNRAPSPEDLNEPSTAGSDVDPVMDPPMDDEGTGSTAPVTSADNSDAAVVETAPTSDPTDLPSVAPTSGGVTLSMDGVRVTTDVKDIPNRLEVVPNTDDEDMPTTMDCPCGAKDWNVAGMAPGTEMTCICGRQLVVGSTK